jgi:hypothetical protein
LNLFVMRKRRCESPTNISISVYEYSYHFSMFLVELMDYLMYYKSAFKQLIVWVNSILQIATRR